MLWSAVSCREFGRICWRRLRRRHLRYTPVTARMHGPSVNILDRLVLQLRKSKVLARMDDLGLSFTRGRTMSVDGPSV